MTVGIVLLLVALAAAVLVEVVIRRRRARLETPRDHLRAGDRAYTKRDFDSAAEHYREAIRLDHQNPEAHYKLAGLAWERDDYDGVIEHLRECQRWAPEVADVEHGLGAAHYHKGDYEAALGHYGRALELAPEDQEVRANLAAVYHELGRTEEAKEVCPEFEPPSAEERERAERIERVWAKMGLVGHRRLRRWGAVVASLVWALRVSRMVFISCLLAIVVTLVYGLIALPSRLWLADRYGGVLAAVLKSAFAIAVLSIIALNLIERERGRVLRRVMMQSGVSREDAEAVAPPQTGQPWWRTELSGGHLVLWLGLPVLAVLWSKNEAFPEWCVAVAIYLTVMWFFKGMFMFGLLIEQGDRRGRWHREYRWFGTLKGALVGLIVLPAALTAAAFAVWWLMELIGL